MLFVTLEFSNPSGQNGSTVTVPLGSYSTRTEPYHLDPVGPQSATGFLSLGAANSVWIPNPFRVQTGVRAVEQDLNQAQHAGPVQPPGVSDGAVQPSKSGDPTHTPRGEIPLGTPAVHQTPNNAGVNADAPGGQGVPPVLRSAVIPLGSDTRQVSIVVTINEVRKGNPLARTLAAVLRGSRQGVVNLVDPAQRTQARQAEQTAATALVSAFQSARVKYATAYQAYCLSPGPATAPTLWDAQRTLLRAAHDAQADDQVPQFTIVNPDTGYSHADSNTYCAGFPQDVAFSSP